MTHIGQSRNKNTTGVKAESSGLNPTLPLPAFGQPNQQIQQDTAVDSPPQTNTIPRQNQTKTEENGQEIVTKLKEDNKELAIEREIMAQNVDKLKEQVNYLSGENQKLSDLRKQDQLTLIEKDSRIQELSRGQTALVPEELSKKDALIQSLKSELDIMSKKLSDQQIAHQEETRKYNEKINSELAGKNQTSEINNIRDSSLNQELATQVSQLKEKYAALSKHSEELGSELAFVQNDRDKLRQAVQLLESRYGDLENELDAVIQEKNAMFLTSEELRRRISELEELHSRIASSDQLREGIYEQQTLQLTSKIEEVISKNQQLAQSHDRLLSENGKLEQAINLQSNDMEKMIHEIDRLKPYYRDAQLVQEQMLNYNTLLQETLILRQENQDLAAQIQNTIRSPPDLITVQVSEQGEITAGNRTPKQALKGQPEGSIKNQELDIQFLKKQIADITRQKEQYEELYSSSRREHDVLAQELKELKKSIQDQNTNQNFTSVEISKAFDEITTLKAKLISSQTQQNKLESNHFAEIEKLSSLNDELVNKMKDELSQLKKEKMQLLSQTQQLLTKNQELKKNISHFQAKEQARSQEDSALDFWRENVEKISFEKRELERKIEEYQTKESNYKQALKTLNQTFQEREKEWDSRWKLRESSYTQNSSSQQTNLTKRIAEDEIAKLHLAAIIIKQREQEWKKLYKENNGNIKHQDEESQKKWDKEKEKWLSDWKITKGILQGLPSTLHKYFPGYEFISDVPLIVSIEKTTTSASVAHDLTPGRFESQDQSTSVKKIQQDLFKSTYSNTETLNGSQSARVLPKATFENNHYEAAREKLVTLPDGKVITETGYRLHQANQSYQPPQSQTSSGSILKQEKRSRSKSPYANRPQLDVATGYHTTNGFYPQQESFNPATDAKEIVLNAYSKLMAEQSDVNDIVKRYQTTDLYNKV